MNSACLQKILRQMVLSTIEEKSKNHPGLNISALFYFTYRLFNPREIFLKDEEPFLYSSRRTAFKTPVLMGPLELPLHDSQRGRWRGLPYAAWLIEDHGGLSTLQGRFYNIQQAFLTILSWLKASDNWVAFLLHQEPKPCIFKDIRKIANPECFLLWNITKFYLSCNLTVIDSPLALQGRNYVLLL